MTVLTHNLKFGECGKRPLQSLWEWAALEWTGIEAIWGMHRHSCGKKMFGSLSGGTQGHEGENGMVMGLGAHSRRERPEGRGKGGSRLPRPTHFLSLQVSQSPEIRECMKTIQDNLTAKYPELAGALVHPASAHLTLMVMCLGNQGMSVSDCADLLRSSMPILSEKGLLRPIDVTLRGLGHFNKKVLFLDVLPGEELDHIASIASVLSDHFSANGLQNNGKDFVGHVTIAKLSKMPNRQHHKRKKHKKQNRSLEHSEGASGTGGLPPKDVSESHVKNDDHHPQDQGPVAGGSQEAERGYKKAPENPAEKRIRAIPEDAFKDFMDVEAGSITVSEVHLCRMKDRDPNGYYHTEAVIPLGSD